MVTMRRLLSAVLVFILVLSFFSLDNTVHAATPVSGAITSDTTWSQSLIQLTGPVSVNKGVTLTIAAGVTVDFSSYYIQVNGTLHANGAPNAKTIFKASSAPSYAVAQLQFMDSSTDWNDQTGYGSIVQNIVFDTTSISVSESSPKITSCEFKNPLWVTILSRTGSPIITGNTFENIKFEGISVSGSAVVTNNVFSNTTGQATAIVAHERATVSNNKIVKFYNGICIDGSITVKDNVISDCANAGIWGLNINANIEKNYLSNNYIGVDGVGNIKSNTIVHNQIGIQAKSAATVSDNNIVDNTKYALVANESGNVVAANNWWGTINTQTIKQKIWDYSNDFNLGKVNFEPILNQPSTNAPQDENIDLDVTGEFGFFLDSSPLAFQVEANILMLSQGALLFLVVGWVVVLAVFLIRRARKVKVKVSVSY